MSRCVCPRIVDEDWQDCEHVWNKVFYSVRSPHLFSVPIRLGRDIGRVTNSAREEGFEIVDSPRMLLSRYALFRGEVLVEVVDRQGDHPTLRRFVGARLYSQVHYGHWRDLGAGVRRLIATLGMRPKRIYFWYVTCPLCADERGQKTVIFGEL
jgi:hypothetical protein